MPFGEITWRLSKSTRAPPLIHVVAPPFKDCRGDASAALRWTALIRASSSRGSKGFAT